MPNYGSNPPQNIVSGLPYFLFNQEVPVPIQKSIACVSPGASHSLYAPILFVINFTIAPISDTILIQGSMQDIDAQYQTLKTSSNLQQDNYTDFGLFTFYRAVLQAWVPPANSPQGTLTIQVVRK